MMKPTARQIAYNVLLKIFKDNAYSNLALNAALKESQLDLRDKAFAGALVYGTCERLVTLDYALSCELSKPIGKLKAPVLTILRLGAFQLLFMNSVPASAAVNESVRLAKLNGCSYAAGLVNAVLRNIDRNGLVLPDKKDSLKFLSVKYSCPQWLVEKWLTEYGEEKAESILSCSLKTDKLTLRVNTLKITQNELCERFLSKGIECEKGAAEDSLALGSLSSSVEELEEFRSGLFHVQGIPSQLCAKALGAKEGDTVLDLCAAPGGKTFTLAQMMNNKGKIMAFDLYESRVALIKKGAERLGLKIVEAAAGNAEVFNPSLKESADCVICDVPCSGLGIISKKPEIKFKKPDELSSLPDIQYRILKNGSQYVKKGGRLVYSTCTLNKAENEEVCLRFINENPNFKPEKPFPKFSNDCFATVFPNACNSDGFFTALFVKEGENE